MLKISIELDPVKGPMADQLDVHMLTLGYARKAPTDIYAKAAQELYGSAPAPVMVEALAAPSEMNSSAIKETLVFSEEGFLGEQPEPETVAEKVVVNGETMTRQEAVVRGDVAERVPGQPAPGRKRRSRAEVEADDAYFATHGKAIPEPVAEDEAEPDSIFGGDLVQSKAAAQDAADEARETAATKTGLTLDDLRKAVGAYQSLHGTAAAIKNVPRILGKPMYEVTDDELVEAIAKIEAATAKAPTKVVTDAPAPAKTEKAKPIDATKEGVIAALRRYALRFDGQDRDLSAAGAPATQEDGKKIVKAAIGVENLAQMPNDPATFAKLIEAIDLALANNQFGREVITP